MLVPAGRGDNDEGNRGSWHHRNDYDPYCHDDESEEEEEDDDDDSHRPYWRVEPRQQFRFWDNMLSLRWCWPTTAAKREPRRRSRRRIFANGRLRGGGAGKRVSLTTSTRTSRTWTESSAASLWNTNLTNTTTATSALPVRNQRHPPMRVTERDDALVVVHNKQERQHYHHHVEEGDPHVSVVDRSSLIQKRKVLLLQAQRNSNRSLTTPTDERQRTEQRDEVWCERSPPTTHRARVAGGTATCFVSSPRPPRPPPRAPSSVTYSTGPPTIHHVYSTTTASVASNGSSVPMPSPVQHRVSTTASVLSYHRRRKAQDSFCFSATSLQQILSEEPPNVGSGLHGHHHHHYQNPHPPIGMIFVNSNNNYNSPLSGTMPTTTQRGRIISVASRGLTDSSTEDEVMGTPRSRRVRNHHHQYPPSPSSSASHHFRASPSFGGKKPPCSPSSGIVWAVPFPEESPRSVMPPTLVLADDSVPPWMMEWAGQPQQQQQQQQADEPRQQGHERISSIVTTETCTSAATSSSNKQQRTDRGCFLPMLPRPPHALDAEEHRESLSVDLQGWAAVSLGDGSIPPGGSNNNNNHESFVLWYVQAQADGAVIHLSQWSSSSPEQQDEEAPAECYKRIELLAPNSGLVSLELESVSSRAGHCLSIYQQKKHEESPSQQAGGDDSNPTIGPPPRNPKHKVLSILPVRLSRQQLEQEQEQCTTAERRQEGEGEGDNGSTAGSTKETAATTAVTNTPLDQILSANDGGRLYAPAEQHDAVLHWRFSLDLLWRSSSQQQQDSHRGTM